MNGASLASIREIENKSIIAFIINLVKLFTSKASLVAFGWSSKHALNIHLV